MNTESPTPNPFPSSSHFPEIISKKLSGTPVTLPRDFPGERTIVFAAFAREQQDSIDGWVEGLKLKGSDLPWIELPIIEDPGLLTRWFIDRGMRSGIPDRNIWEHVITIYTAKRPFLDQLGIVAEDKIHVLVVDRKGSILERVEGDYSEEKEKIIRKSVSRT